MFFLRPVKTNISTGTEYKMVRILYLNAYLTLYQNLYVAYIKFWKYPNPVVTVILIIPNCKVLL